MTDNIFQMASTALAQRAPIRNDGGILLFDFAGAMMFLGHIYDDTETSIEHAGRGQFAMARGVRQSCSASGFYYTICFDPILQWRPRLSPSSGLRLRQRFCSCGAFIQDADASHL